VTTDLKAAVLAYLAEQLRTEVFDSYVHYDSPVFRQDSDGETGERTTHHVEGRPGVTAVSLELLDGASGYPDGGLGWDGECLTMPGDLRYRPVGLDERGWFVVCVKVGP
jgi:hypothetical protein